MQWKGPGAKSLVTKESNRKTNIMILWATFAKSSSLNFVKHEIHFEDFFPVSFFGIRKKILFFKTTS